MVSGFALSLLTSLLLVNGVHLVRLNMDNKPVFQIVKWLESDDYQWKNYGEANAGLSYNSSTYIIPGEITGIVLECNATYPVEIVFETDDVFETMDLMFTYHMMTKARREANSITDKNSFQYSMKFQVFSTTNTVTGSYICQSTQYPEVQTRIYIMWEGNGPYLIGAKTTITVPSAKKDFVILPCRISTSDAEVFLEKNTNVTKENNETAMEFVPLSVNESITFDPTYGFSLNVKEMGNVDGFYRCFTDEPDDEMYINVTAEVTQIEPRSGPTMRGSQVATLNYEPNHSHGNSLVCCSNSARPPTLVYLGVPTPTLSKFLRKILVKNFQLLSKFSPPSSPTKNCSRQYIYGYSGLAICKGDGIDTALDVFFPVERTENGTHLDEIYKSWSDAKPENLLRIQVLNVSTIEYEDQYGEMHQYTQENPWGPHVPMYTGQNVSFRCENSPYYFATGIKWKIEFENKVIEWPDFSDIGDLNEYMYYWINPKPITISVHDEMTSISCYAPVWNSSDWVEKKFALHVQEPTEPVIHSNSPEIIYWTLNDTNKQIDCTVTEGEPAPNTRWMKDGKELIMLDQNRELNTSISGTSVLEFKIVHYDTHGIYTCISTNLGGTTQKSFTVIVEESHPWVGVVVVVIMSCGLILGIGFLVWKIKGQRNMADAIKRTEFQRSRDLD